MSKPRPKLEEEDCLALAERLREAREYLGFSQDEVANFLGMARSALSDLENGQRKISAPELKKLAGLYKCTVASFTRKAEAAELQFAEGLPHLARKAVELSPHDRQELARFVDFLRVHRGMGDIVHGTSVERLRHQVKVPVMVIPAE